jgi:poly-gamma-glutamate synthesis protein (capsule biosynthesis protein)
MVDMGADAVICCHTHCPITWETHAGKPIVYGLGNLIFEPLRKVPPDWHEGYLATLLFEGSGIRLQITPYNQSASLPGAQRMSGDAAKRFIASFEQQSLRLQDGAFIAEEWRKYCLTKKPEYLPGLFAYNRYMHRFRGLLLGRLHTKKGILGALLLSQCETHQEVLSTLFREERKSWDE